MKQRLKSGDLVSINPAKTIFWGNKEGKKSPDFSKKTAPNSHLKMTGVVIDADITQVYIQVLTDQKTIWVASKSIEVI